MDSELDPVKQDIRNVRERIVRYEQRLAAAEQAGDTEEEKSFIDLLSRLQEKENILLRSQAPSKPCLWLVRTGLPVYTSFALQSVNAKLQPGFYYVCSKSFIVAQAFLLTVVLSGISETLMACCAYKLQLPLNTARHTLCLKTKHLSPGACCRASSAFQFTISIHDPYHKNWAAFRNEHYQNAF